MPPGKHPPGNTRPAPGQADPSSRTAMTERASPIPPPRQAGPARRVLHTLITLAGWALFLYWWWIVVHRVSGRELRFTALFIAVSLAIIVFATLAWAWHNLRIFKRRGPRLKVRESIPDFSHDGIGRTIEYGNGRLDRQSAAVVYVRFSDDGKSYEFAPWLPPRTDVTPRDPARGKRAP
jgi:hypothetical protein